MLVDDLPRLSLLFFPTFALFCLVRKDLLVLLRSPAPEHKIRMLNCRLDEDVSFVQFGRINNYTLFSRVSPQVLCSHLAAVFVFDSALMLLPVPKQ